MRALLFVFVMFLFVSCDHDFNYSSGEECNEEKRGELGGCCFYEEGKCKSYSDIIVVCDRQNNVCVEFGSGKDDLVSD